jgi:hypothetical protein
LRLGTASDQEKLRREIAGQIKRLADEAASKTITGDTATVELDRIKALQAILAALPQRPTFPLVWAAAIGTICLIGASLAWSIHIPRTRVQLDLTTAAVVARVDNDFSWHGSWRLSPDRAQLQNLTDLVLPPEYRDLQSLAHEGSLELNVQGGNVRLRRLFVGRGAELQIAHNETGSTAIVIRGAPFRADIDVSGSVTGSAGTAPGKSLPLHKLDPVGDFAFQYDRHDAVPALLNVSPLDVLTLSEMAVAGLSFFQEQADGTQASTFFSQIIYGKLTITATGEHIPLPAGATLHLDDARGLVAALRVAPKSIQLKFAGTASGVTLGAGDFSRNLKPTILEWLFHEQRLGFFWAVVTFLWGIAWSVRTLWAGSG